MDFETGQLLELYRHVFPDFTHNHMLVYRALWRIEPVTAERVILETGLGRATVFRSLSELMHEGLVRKNGSRPVGYLALNPLKSFSLHSRRVSMKLRKGRLKIQGLIENSSGLSGELYLVKSDGGQQRLISKETRQAVLDESELIRLRRAIDTQLQEVGQLKVKAWESWR